MSKNSKSERTYKLVELVGTSRTSYEDAIKNAVADASKSLDDLNWFQVTEFRGAVKDGRVTEFQAVLKVGFQVHR